MSGGKVWRAEQLRQHPELRPAAEREQLARGELTLGVPDAITVQPDRPVFVCPRCSARSSHPVDVAEGYCGRCHDWTGGVTGGTGVHA